MALEISETRPVHRPVAVLRLPLLIAVYALAALIVAPATFWHLLASYFFQMILLAEILVVAIPIAGLVLRPRAPVAMMRDILRYDSKRLLFTVLGFCFGMAAFTTFKISIPHLVPFYGDSLFADIDHWLHGGDPGLFLHRIIPDWASGGIFFFYNVVWFFAWFGLLGFVALQRDAVLRRHYFWTMTLSFMLVGTVLATLLSSVGPIFYDDFIPGGRFEALMSQVFNSGAGASVRGTASYLLAAYEGKGEIVGTGISAMPSMHVAVVTLNALMLSSLKIRALQIAGWAYALFVLAGSVYLGWHYAIDGYVSIVVVSLLWWSIGKVVRPEPQRQGEGEPSLRQ